MMRELEAGLHHSERLLIHEGLTVPHVSEDFPAFHGMPPVFATAYMIGFVEATCIRALESYLEEGRHTVGTLVNLDHSAPTPIGSTVTAHVELVSVNGNRLRFRVECEDDHGPIGSGVHERMIIDIERFMTHVKNKQSDQKVS